MKVSKLRDTFEGENTSEIRTLLDEWFQEQIKFKQKNGENIQEIQADDIKDMMDEVGLSR